jgi:hypothetical protein
LAARGRDGLKAGVRPRIALECAADNVHGRRVVGWRAGEKVAGELAPNWFEACGHRGQRYPDSSLNPLISLRKLDQ